MNFNRDHDIPLDLDLTLEDFFLFLVYEHSLIDKAPWFYISMFFCIISFSNNDEAISSNFIVVELLSMEKTKLSHDFGRKHKKLMHFCAS